MPKQLAKVMLACLLTAGGSFQAAYAQQAAGATQTVSACTGTVLDTDGEPMIGASVFVVGTTNGSTTNLDGHFSIKGVKPGSTLRVSSIGFETVEVKWNGQPVNVTMKAGATALDEVVVVGYGTQKKVNLTGAVAAVSGDQINDRPVTNVGQALQGVIGNLIVTPGSGAPGQGASFNVRGVTSISGNSATQGGPLVLVDNVQMDINLVNPDDIESISVLKDGASAAIYGARAAYGVILITTKKGKANEKPTINFSANWYWSNAALEYHKVNSLNYINMYDDAQINRGGSQEFTGLRRQMIEDFYYGRPNSGTRDGAVYVDPGDTNGKYSYCGNTDWWDALYKTSFNQNYNINISGGTGKTTYYASLGLFDQGTNRVGADEDYKRWNAKVSVNTELTSWLSVGANITNSYISESHPTGSANSGVTNMGGYFKGDLSPLMPVKHPDGNYAGQGSYTNPIAMAKFGGTTKFRTNDLWLTGIARLTPLEGLMIQADYTWNFYSRNYHLHNTTFMEYGVPGGYAVPYIWSSPSKVQYNQTNDYYSSFNVFGQYDKTFNDKHNLSVMVGYNQERKTFYNFWAQRNNMITNDLLMLNQGTGQLTAGNGTRTSNTQYAINSVFGRINYDFMGKYLVEFTGRYDGTSRFPDGHRYGFFPSGSLGWRISEESFFEPIRNWWNNMKIRVSYGQLGNQSMDPRTWGYFPYLPSYSINGNYGYLINGSTVSAVGASGLVSSNFTWEKVNQIDLGFDFGFFNNRLSGDFDWYSRETKGALVSGSPLPGVLGTSVPVENAANIRSNGWELALSWNDRVSSIGLNYYARLSLSDNWAVVTKYANPNPTDINLSYLYKGKKIGEIWGFESNGLFQSREEIENHASQSYIYGGQWNPGDVKYEDLDGNGAIDDGDWTLKNPGDNKVIGNSMPRYMFGITVGAEWKGIDFEMFWQGTGKRDVWGGSLGQFWAFPNQWEVPLDEAMDYWRDEETWSVANGYNSANRGGFFPRVYLGNNGRNQQTSTRYLLSAAYGRLKNLQIGYTLPKAWTMKAGISKVRVYLQGENLLTISPMKKYADPEVYDKLTYPIQKKYSIGLNITF